MTPKQMLAFGELYRNKGRSGTVRSSRSVGQRIVPAAHAVALNNQGYGYGWWSREFAGYETFFAWGYGGQYIFIVPELDLVVVTTSSTAVGEERRSHRRTIFDLLEQTILPLSRGWKPTPTERGRVFRSPTTGRASPRAASPSSGRARA